MRKREREDETTVTMTDVQATSSSIIWRLQQLHVAVRGRLKLQDWTMTDD